MVHDKQVKDVVSGWLTVFDDGSVDRTWTGPPEVKFMAEPVPPHDDFIDGVAVKDVVAGENSGSRFRIYLPEPRVANAIIVSVFLPLAPEHRLPAACDVGFAGLLWLRDVSRKQGHEPWLNEYADFNRVFLIGDSSGGNIVHQVAARAGEEDLSPMRLAGAIPIIQASCGPSEVNRS
ncbi:hypothetical protein KY285_033339 [Solanum tuberosum]|nr:hypothetical protein KY285_033339 [Solanum tuberosum]